MARRLLRVSVICLLTITAVLTGAPTVSGVPQLTSHESKIDPEWDLKHHCPDLRVLRDRQGKIVWFSHEQMKQMALVKLAPKMPAQAQLARVEGQVAVNLCVDTEGLPHDVWAVTGHPLLIGSAIDAASTWRFKPYEVKLHPIAFAGTLVFTFSSSKGNSY